MFLPALLSLLSWLAVFFTSRFCPSFLPPRFPSHILCISSSISVFFLPPSLAVSIIQRRSRSAKHFMRCTLNIEPIFQALVHLSHKVLCKTRFTNGFRTITCYAITASAMSKVDVLLQQSTKSSQFMMSQNTLSDNSHRKVLVIPWLQRFSSLPIEIKKSCFSSAPTDVCVCMYTRIHICMYICTPWELWTLQWYLNFPWSSDCPQHARLDATTALMSARESGFPSTHPTCI